MSALDLRRQLPRVLIATFVVVSIPLVSVWTLEALTGFRSPLVSIGAVVALSFLVASAGAAYWARQPGSSELVFGDLMVWGWIRRIRAERRLAEVHQLLGLGRSGTSVLQTDLSEEEQTALLQSLASTLEARDPYTHGHTKRVTRHVEVIAKGMGLSDEQVAKIRTSAALHDVGKMEIPRNVLNKPGKLTDDEFEIVKRHPVTGAEMVASLGNAELSAIVGHHHERIDGRGYPDGLVGDAIPLGARIIAVADTFDAVTSSRPYRKALSHRQALDILKNESGKQLDGDAVHAFLTYYSGSRSASRWSFFVSAPERIAGGLRDALQSTVAAPITKNAVAVAATAVLGTSLAAPIASAVGTGKPTQPRPSKSATAKANAGVVAGYVGAAIPSTGGKSSARNSRVRAGDTSVPRSRSDSTTGAPAVPGGAVSSPEQPTEGAKDDANGNARHTDKPPKPDKADKPDKVEKPDKPASSKPNPPGQDGTPPGHANKPASPGGGPPADSPSEGNEKLKKK